MLYGLGFESHKRYNFFSILNYVCDIVVKSSRSLSLNCWWALVIQYRRVTHTHRHTIMAITRASLAPRGKKPHRDFSNLVCIRGVHCTKSNLLRRHDQVVRFRMPALRVMYRIKYSNIWLFETFYNTQLAMALMRKSTSIKTNRSSNILPVYNWRL